MFVPMGALCLVMALFVVDVGLPEEKPKEKVRDSEAHDDERRDEEERNSSPSSAEVPEDTPVSEKATAKAIDARAQRDVEKFV